jgi:hypothetical protein
MQKLSFLHLLLPFSFWLLFTDSPTVKDKIIEGLENWRNNYPQEKVFLQIDRNRYAAGELLWFKATCTYDSKPSFLSKIIYVTITNKQGVVLNKSMYKLDANATANGTIDISSKWASDSYNVNAYTLWMQNFPTHIASQNIYVYNSDYIKTKQIQNNEPEKIYLDFFPEGGNLIEGINQRCAFKATNHLGYPISLNTVVQDESGNTITPLQTNHDGMGFFEIEPKAGKTYQVKLTNKKEQPFSFILPKVKQGFSLSVTNNNPNKLFISVNKSEQEKQQTVIVTAHSNGKLFFIDEFNFNEDKTATALSKKNLPPGILQITLFDTLGNPLAERITFIENYTINKPFISSKTKNFQPKALNEFSITIDSTQNANVSVLVSAYNAKANLELQNNIASHFLLASDIKGYVHNAGYYFIDKSPQRLQHLDLVMLTNGWRRFTWKQILDKDSLPIKFPIESNLSFKGKVFKSDRNVPITNGAVAMMLRGEDSSKILYDAIITDKGEFIADSVELKKKGILYYMGTNALKQRFPVDVKFYENYIDTLSKELAKPILSNDTTDLAYQNSEYDSYFYKKIAQLQGEDIQQLGEVRVYTKKLSRIDSLNEAYTSALFNMSDQTLDVSKATGGYINIWQYLRQYVVGLNVDPFAQGGDIAVSFNRNNSLDIISEDANDNVRFFLNEVEVSVNIIDNVNVDEVALAKIYKGGSAMALGASRGAIAIYTKKGSNYKPIYQKEFSQKEVQGFSWAREFYSPVYKSPESFNQIDKRLTLFWQPNISLKNNSQQFGFYNNDVSNGYHITVQGIDKNGLLIFNTLPVQ